MIPIESERPDTAPAPAPRRSLSWRVMWFTLAAMVGVELLLFLPAMQRERQKWLDARIVAAQIAVQALPDSGAPERAAAVLHPATLCPACGTGCLRDCLPAGLVVVVA